MRIISKFHDYYDTIQRQGQDKSLIYLRNKIQTTNKELKLIFPTYENRYTYNWKNCPTVSMYIIGFCGKLYPTFRMSVGDDFGTHTIKFFYTLEEVDNIIAQTFSKDTWVAYVDSKHSKIWPVSISRNTLMLKFKEISNLSTNYSHLFLKYKSPIFVVYPIGDGCDWNENRVVFNDCLKDVQFFRKFDTMSTFQEISMFLGGMATPQSPMPIIPDILKVQSHGFDKWSFRKEPTKK